MREWESPQLQALALEIKLHWHRRAATTRRMVQAAPTTFVNMARKAMAQPLTPARSTTPLPLQQQPAEESPLPCRYLCELFDPSQEFRDLISGIRGNHPCGTHATGRHNKRLRSRRAARRLGTVSGLRPQSLA